MNLSTYDIECLEKSRLLIERDIAVRYSVDHLSKVAGMSGTKFKCAFKFYYGLNVFAFAQQKRMDKSYSLVSENKIPLKEISRLCGYAHASHFNTAFKKRFLITAKKLRQQNI